MLPGASVGFRERTGGGEDGDVADLVEESVSVARACWGSVSSAAISLPVVAVGSTNVDIAAVSMVVCV